MPRSVSSYFASQYEDEEPSASTPSATASSPNHRRLLPARPSELDLRSRLPNRPTMDVNETSTLLANPDIPRRSYTGLSGPPTPGPRPVSRRPSITGSARMSKNHSRAGSLGLRLASATGLDRSFARLGGGPLSTRTTASGFWDERVWYDQFTSTDWVHDSIADGFRVRELRKRKDARGKLSAWFDSVQGWILVAIIGCITACVAFFVDVTETAIFDMKEGYCWSAWYRTQKSCCSGRGKCEAWRSWSEVFDRSRIENRWIDFAAFNAGVIILALASCILTLLSKTIVPSSISLSTLDENLAAERGQRGGDSDNEDDRKSSISPGQEARLGIRSAMNYYSAAGSGVAEVKVILSGFVLHGYLGVRTLVLKTLSLILSVGSGLSLGKEGPYVHIATCVGNIACRMFTKYNHNDAKRREVLSAAAASGVAVAFGAPIGGVLFSLEEVSYYFPPKTLFRTFFCCIVAALSLKFLNPYGTGKIVMFEVRYKSDWRFFEVITFVLLGALGGAAGALFIKASRFWATTFRRIPAIKNGPLLEVALVALITGLISFWNRYTKLAVTELLFELASPCKDGPATGLCPTHVGEIPGIIRYLFIALLIKAFLTIITFGIKVPAGIYVPSMVVGGLMGRIVGHTIQYLTLHTQLSFYFETVPWGMAWKAV